MAPYGPPTGPPQQGGFDEVVAENRARPAAAALAAPAGRPKLANAPVRMMALWPQ